MTTLTSLPSAALRLLRTAGEPTRISLNALYKTSDCSERAAHLAAVVHHLRQNAEHLATAGDAVSAAELRGAAAIAAMFADVEHAAAARHADSGSAI